LNPAKRLVCLLANAAITIILLVGVLLPSSIQAQTTSGASLTGHITDPSGGAVKDADAVVRNDATGAVTKATTDDQGRFSISDLPSGLYTLEISAAGFATLSRTGLRLAAGESQELAIPLTVQSLSQEVTVEAVASLPAAQLAPSQASLDS